MKCETLQLNLPLYAEGALAENVRFELGEHLQHCPLCRERVSEFQILKNDLRVLARPTVPVEFLDALHRTVIAELAQTKPEPVSIFSEGFRHWLKFRLMPYGVGTIASLLITFAFLSALLTNKLSAPPAGEFAKANAQPALILTDSNTETATGELSLTQADYAALRIPFANESPSINPSGALVALTKSFVRGKMKDEEVVVVADVFGDGIAQIAQVVEPPRSRQILRDLEKALEDDPSDAPFVPAKLDGRSDMVRVVLKIQTVDVATNLKKQKSRKY